MKALIKTITKIIETFIHDVFIFYGSANLRGGGQN